MKYKLGINLDLGYDCSLAEVLLSAKKAGFQAFFLSWKPHLTQKICAIAQMAKQQKMIFSSIHSPFEDICKMWHVDEQTPQILENLIECVRLCRKLDVPTMVVHPFIGFGVEYQPTEQGVQNFQKLVAVAEQLGVNLAFENVEGEVYLTEIMAKLGASPRVGFCWDTGHELCYNRGKHMPEIYANGKLFYTHLNDNVGVTGKDIFWTDDLHLLPFDGINDWQQIARRLNAVGLQCDTLNFELKPYNDSGFDYSKRTMQEYLDEAFSRAKRFADMLD